MGRRPKRRWKLARDRGGKKGQVRSTTARGTDGISVTRRRSSGEGKEERNTKTPVEKSSARKDFCQPNLPEAPKRVKRTIIISHPEEQAKRKTARPWWDRVEKKEKKGRYPRPANWGRKEDSSGEKTNHYVAGQARGDRKKRFQGAETSLLREWKKKGQNRQANIVASTTNKTGMGTKEGLKKLCKHKGNEKKDLLWCAFRPKSNIRKTRKG